MDFLPTISVPLVIFSLAVFAAGFGAGYINHDQREAKHEREHAVRVAERATQRR